MTELPDGWVVASLGDVVDVLDHLRVPVNAKERTGCLGPVPYYGATGQVGWIDEPIFDEELVLLGEDGAPFLDSSKPKAYLIKGPAWVNNHAHVLRASARTSNSFLLHLLNSIDYRQHVNGTTRLKLTQQAMRSIPVPIPPRSEQDRIVATIEEQFSRLDAAETLLHRVVRNAKRLWASRLAAEYFDHTWPTSTVGELAVVGSGATPKRTRGEYYEGGTIPWVTSGQLIREFVDEPSELITEAALKETSVKLWPEGTLLVAMYGEGRTRGHCSELRIEATTNQACAAIVLQDDAPMRRQFLKLFFTASYDKNRRMASGGVQPNLSLGLIKSLMVPLPPLDEQDRIVDELQRHFSLHCALTSSIERSLGHSHKLRSSILSEAFAGSLVPQDPTDLPTSVQSDDGDPTSGVADRSSDRPMNVGTGS